ncbi:uncharacterized protein ACLA_054420 [Aspergillus clavatus NRRL 1]|uniref:Carboxylesterase type B domain-containing protein n=1 Tax=Aspergillus clavatus (strain ATCC 1007 / CBS 513.65 / DSM 816 / NCTC 3887 / NRRL 1 / QM 1276 / 107) TaxID=344612 RepID=A1C971_ASPCL|nr:uncharacterized protein ACLA_054420 [Aspergillus clavatus NRRL 1]EAW13395.1 hypothetical protein ACLA_054420 [Aspergillus clavatus NRRL 1]
MEFGNAVGPPWNGTDWHQPMYDRIVNRTGCSASPDTLQCLREVPYGTIYNNANEGLEWSAAVDGTFFEEYPQISYSERGLAKIPILLGTNTDEECIAQLITSKRWVINREEATQLLTYHANDPALECPYGWGNVTWPKLGLMYKRYASMAGDLTMRGPRRLLAQTLARYEKQVYSYRWDVAALNTSSTIGVGYFAEIPLFFSNPAQDIT